MTQKPKRKYVKREDTLVPDINDRRKINEECREKAPEVWKKFFSYLEGRKS